MKHNLNYNINVHTLTRQKKTLINYTFFLLSLLASVFIIQIIWHSTVQIVIFGNNGLGHRRPKSAGKDSYL